VNSNTNIFSFSGLNHNFVIYIDITHVPASNTETDDVTIWATHRIFNTNL